VSLALDPTVERAPVELAQWLETLRATRIAGRAKAGVIGLARWNEFCAAKLAAAQAIFAAVNRLAAEKEGERRPGRAVSRPARERPGARSAGPHNA
jgi:hypothetical protein